MKNSSARYWKEIPTIKKYRNFKKTLVIIGKNQDAQALTKKNLQRQ